MEKSRLIQRMQKPYKKTNGIWDSPDNPFAFGGGLKNGGLTDEAMNMIRNIFRFEYMGYAEFEHGKVQETLNKMVINQLDLVSGSFKTKYKYIKPYWKEEPEKTYEGSRKIYYICINEHKEEVKKRIKRWALGRGWKETKAPVWLDMGMAEPNKNKEYPDDPCGWLELDNGFMFFVDKEMCEKCCELFGITNILKT